MAEGYKEYKKLRPLLLPVERWVELSRRSSNNAIPRTTTFEEASKAPRNNQDGWPYGGPDNPKTKGTERSTLEETIKMLHTAVTTWGQLRALEEDTTPPAGTKRFSKTPVIEASPKKKTRPKEKTDGPTAEAILDKDMLGRKLTNWEYLMWLHHNSPMAGHPGPKCTLELLTRSSEFVRSMELTCKVEDYIKGCIICAQGKPMRQKLYGMLQPLPIPNRLWQDIAMDFIVKLPLSKDSLEPETPKYNLIWVVIDRFTKIACFLPYREGIRADVLARQFFRDIFANHGLSQSIISDKGSVFAANVTKALYKALDVKRNLSTAFHHQTDGQTECTKQTLKQYLRMYCDHLQDDWVDLFPMTSFAYNNKILASTGHSPFFLNYGYHPQHNISSNHAYQAPAAKKYLKKLADAQKKAARLLIKAQEAQAVQYNRKRKATPAFDKGELTWLL